MATPTNKYWRIPMADGSIKWFPSSLATACADRPTLAYVSDHADLLIDAPTLLGYHLGAANCALPSAKIQELYLARFNGTAALFYAQGSGTLAVRMDGINGTAALSTPQRTMTTNPNENVNPTLFTGSKTHGAYFPAVPNGAYRVSIIDEDAVTQAYNVEMTDTGPVTALYKTTATQPNLSVKSRAMAGPSSVTEANSGTYRVRETMSDNSVRDYSGTVAWSLINAPTGIAINSSGVLSIPADSLSADAQTTVHASFGNGLTLEQPVSLINGSGMTIPVSDFDFEGVLRTGTIPSGNLNWLDVEITQVDIPNGRFKWRNKAPEHADFILEVDNKRKDNAESIWWPMGWPLIIKVFKPIGPNRGDGKPRSEPDDYRADATVNTWMSIEAI